MPNKKIDAIQLQDSETYDIDLPKDASPSIASLDATDITADNINAIVGITAQNIEVTNNIEASSLSVNKISTSDSSSDLTVESAKSINISAPNGTVNISPELTVSTVSVSTSLFASSATINHIVTSSVSANPPVTMGVNFITDSEYPTLQLNAEGNAVTLNTGSVGLIVQSSNKANPYLTYYSPNAYIMQNDNGLHIGEKIDSFYTSLSSSNISLSASTISLSSSSITLSCQNTTVNGGFSVSAGNYAGANISLETSRAMTLSADYDVSITSGYGAVDINCSDGSGHGNCSISLTPNDPTYQGGKIIIGTDSTRSLISINTASLNIDADIISTSCVTLNENGIDVSSDVFIEGGTVLKMRGGNDDLTTYSSGKITYKATEHDTYTYNFPTWANGGTAYLAYANTPEDAYLANYATNQYVDTTFMRKNSVNYGDPLYATISVPWDSSATMSYKCFSIDNKIIKIVGTYSIKKPTLTTDTGHMKIPFFKGTASVSPLQFFCFCTWTISNNTPVYITRMISDFRWDTSGFFDVLSIPVSQSSPFLAGVAGGTNQGTFVII